MTSPRDESLERMAAAAKGIRKEWRVVSVGKGDRIIGIDADCSDQFEAADVARDWRNQGGVDVRVEWRHVTPWQPDPGVEVATGSTGEGERDTTPTPADSAGTNR